MHLLKLVFPVLLLPSLVTCFFNQSLPSSHQRKNNNSFVKNSNNNNDNNDNDNNSAVAAASTSLETVTRYLEPFALELTTTTTTTDGGDNNKDERFVRTLVDRSVGDVLLEIPLDDTITVEQVRRRRLGLQNKINNDNDNDNEDHCKNIDVDDCIDDDDTDLDEKKLDDEEALGLALLQLRYEEIDIFTGVDPYVVNVLPKTHFTIWTLPIDLWKETSKILPRCYSETFDATRQKVNEFVKRIISKNDKYTVDDALWAFSNVRTRSVAVPELLNDPNDDDENIRVPLALIPGLDLLNHGFGSGTQLQLVPESKSESNSKSSMWVITSSSDLKAGDEVFLSYGDDKDNWKLLLTYGFTIPNNPNAVVFWTWQDLLDAANKVRPNTFGEYACRQLLDHPGLKAYMIVSEDRATFSYDAESNTPRESLSNGLTMLNSLAAQLGHPEEDDGNALAKDVLDELQRRRLDELKNCQSKLKIQQAERKNLGVYSEWNPFFEALRVALESEEKAITNNNNNNNNIE
ncbi:MAG: hypothetical protein ACI8RD_011191 [Bacillariaceae sp.]|jgi:hypothetical protein